MPARRVKRTVGAITVEAPAVVEDLAARLSRGAAARVATAIEQRVALRLADARSKWPVRTGASRESIQAQIVEHRTSVEITIRPVGVDYTVHVHRAGQRAELWQTLVIDPLTARAEVRTIVEHSTRALMAPVKR